MAPSRIRILSASRAASLAERGGKFIEAWKKRKARSAFARNGPRRQHASLAAFITRPQAELQIGASGESAYLCLLCQPLISRALIIAGAKWDLPSQNSSRSTDATPAAWSGATATRPGSF